MMNAKFSIRFFTGVLIVTGVLLVVIGIHNYEAQKSVNDLKERYLQIEQFRNQVFHVQKDNDSKSIKHLNELFKKQMDAAVAAENSKVNLSQISFITVFILLLLSWLIILRITRQSQEALIYSNHQLEELNKTLDQKVQERTRDLEIVQGQLLKSEKFSAIGQLAAGIAHEINNPIGFINSNLQTLEKYVARYKKLFSFFDQFEGALINKDQDQMTHVLAAWKKVRSETNFEFIESDIGNLLNESREGTENMRKIVADLCAFARPDKGREVLVDLEALMESMLNLVYNEIKYKAQLKKDYGRVPSLMCNPQMIGQVFVNLLTNAAHSIESNGFITIKTYVRKRNVCVDITDTGCGIPPENLDKIFDPSFSPRPVGPRVGLGLIISYDIVRRHEGYITLNSKVGEGTTVTVTLPMEHMNESLGRS